MNSVMELFVLMQHRYGPQGRSQLDDIFEDLALENLRHSQRANMDCTIWHRTKPHRALMYLSVCV